MSYFKAIMHQVRFLAEGDRAEGAYKRGKGREGLAPNLKKHQSPLPPPVSTAVCNRRIGRYWTHWSEGRRQSRLE